MKNITINVYPHKYFIKELEESGVDDTNVEKISNCGFIEIIGSEECLKYYLKEDTKHYFKIPHNNVMLLEFDDLEKDLEYDGHIFKAMTMVQAENLVNFVEESINNGIDNFKICCRAGISRSRAVSEFIARIAEERGIEVDYPERGKYANILNAGVLNKLSRVYYKKHKMYE